MSDDTKWIAEKKTEPIEKVAREWGLPLHSICAIQPSEEEMRKLTESIGKNPQILELSHVPTTIDILPSPMLMVACALYAQAVSKPIAVNDPESHPDYEQIAKDCFQRAKDTTPYLLREMGLLPKGDADAVDA